MATRNSKKRKLNETDLVPTELLSEASMGGNLDLEAGNMNPLDSSEFCMGVS